MIRSVAGFLLFYHTYFHQMDEGDEDAITCFRFEEKSFDGLSPVKFVMYLLPTWKRLVPDWTCYYGTTIKLQTAIGNRAGFPDF